MRRAFNIRLAKALLPPLRAWNYIQSRIDAIQLHYWWKLKLWCDETLYEEE